MDQLDVFSLESCIDLKCAGKLLINLTALHPFYRDLLKCALVPETLKLLQEGAGNTLELIGIGKGFLNRTPAAQQLRERMNKWDLIKLKFSAQ
jgi:hypothetical protein